MHEIAEDRQMITQKIQYFGGRSSRWPYPRGVMFNVLLARTVSVCQTVLQSWPGVKDNVVLYSNLNSLQIYSFTTISVLS